MNLNVPTCRGREINFITSKYSRMHVYINFSIDYDDNNSEVKTGFYFKKGEIIFKCSNDILLNNICWLALKTAR